VGVDHWRRLTHNLSGDKVGCAASPLVKKGNRRQTECAFLSRHGAGDLEEGLGAHKVGLEARPEWIAPPANAGRVEAGAAQQRIVENGAKWCAWGKLVGDGAADDGEDLGHGNTVLREEAVSGAPILKLGTGSSEQAGHGVASETEQ
jgi:hypothetical protein